MVLYFVYKASKEYKNRGLIPKRLKALGCRRVCRSFWAVDDDKTNDVLKVIRENQPILLKRSREIKKPRFDDEDNLIDIGSLVIVAYNAEKVEKGKVRGWLRKTPYIRLCRSVYAFCQNPSQYDRKGKLVDVSRFFSFIKEVDEDAKIFPRMIIINTNSDSIHILLERVRMRIEKEVDEVFRYYRSLLQMVVDSKIDKKRLNEEEKKLYKRFLSIKRIANFYDKWLKVDFARDMMKIYPVTRKLQSVKA